VTPQDLAATVFTYLRIDPEAQWLDRQGRPFPIVAPGGRVRQRILAFFPDGG
jgi:hypothetical protein